MNRKKNKGSFKKGNKGKPKGAETKVKKKARELFLHIMEGEIEHVKKSLDDVRKDEKASDYINCLSKLLPYFIPRQLELHNTGPTHIVVSIKSKDGKQTDNA